MGFRNENGGIVATRKRVEVPAVTLSGDELGAESREEIQKRLGIGANKAYRILHFYAKEGKLRTTKIPAVNIRGEAYMKSVYWTQE